MCYLIAKEFDKKGCIAVKTDMAKHWRILLKSYKNR